MNTMIKMLAAATALVAGGAQAQVYVQGSVGSNHWDMSCSGNVSCDERTTSLRLLGGYAFSNGIALEAGYADYGKAKLQAPSGLPGITTIPMEIDLKAAGPFVGMAYHHSFGTNWGFVFRGGVASQKTKGDARASGISVSVSDTTTQPYFGAGLNYAINKTIKLELGLDLTRAEFEDGRDNLRAINLSLRAQF